MEQEQTSPVQLNSENFKVEEQLFDALAYMNYPPEIVQSFAGFLWIVTSFLIAIWYEKVENPRNLSVKSYWN